MTDIDMQETDTTEAALVDPVELRDRLRDTTDEVVFNKRLVFARGRDLLHAKNDLDEKIAEATFAGEIAGKNQAERDAAARKLFAIEFGQVAEAEESYEAMRLELQQAELHLQLARDELRLLEVVERIRRGE